MCADCSEPTGEDSEWTTAVARLVVCLRRISVQIVYLNQNAHYFLVGGGGRSHFCLKFLFAFFGFFFFSFFLALFIQLIYKRAI